MKHLKTLLYASALAAISFTSCSRTAKNGKHAATHLYKGLYSYGPEVKSFTECEESRQYWVTDSVKKLELAYADMRFEKPYEPVYVEVEGYMEKSDTTKNTGDYDSTLVVLKLNKISKDAPEGPCAN